MSFAGEQIEPFYFDSHGHALFGCYHAPAPGAMRDCAVLLCYPLGHEYLQSHRSYRQLARHLAESGFAVLRFDYFGCGDSEGDDGQGGIDCWLRDIAAALAEVGEKSRCSRLCLVGARMGATLVMLAGSQYGGVDAMVLWDPVVSGKTYVQEMFAAHREMLRRSHVKVKAGSSDETMIELLGFSYRPSFMSELEAIELLAIQKRAAHRALILRSQGQPKLHDLLTHLQGIDCAAEHYCLNASPLWPWEENFGKTLVPYHALRTIVTWLCRVCP